MDMVVYGDPSFEQSAGALGVGLRARLKLLLCPMKRSRGAEAGEVSLDTLRSLLIQAGQFEQAVRDAPPETMSPGDAGVLTDRVEELTDHAAMIFASHFGVGSRDLDPRALLKARLFKMDEVLDAMHPVPEARLDVKVPEGFAFYCLYPEQYCTAALQWLADRAQSKRRPAVVVGIRSIGTTLSAVVQATLRLNHCAVHRITVRPAGHPFSREVDIRAEDLRDAECALIVDEGPGLSGSSMAAAAQALVRLGLNRREICFLPGHERGPGQAASEEVRAWWDGTRRYVTSLEDMRWNGCSLEEMLTSATHDLLGAEACVRRVEDFSGGVWRGANYERSADWPAVCTDFEATKYRCVLEDGRSVLWRFAGLASGPGGQDMAEAALARLKQRAAAGWTATPLGVSQGFVGLPWIEGKPLTVGDADPATLAHIGRYIASVAGRPVSVQEQDAAWKRLREMLYWNVWESLGEEAANRTRALSEVAAGLAPWRPVRVYGDGRLSPHEWIRTSDGRLFKTDVAGHELDHTVLGRQPMAWDLAGAIVEWGLEGQAAEVLLDAAQSAGAELPLAGLMAFYKAAYAAFRVGQCMLCAQTAADPEERTRLALAGTRYQSEIEGMLRRVR